MKHSKINWIYFPKSDKPPEIVKSIVKSFEASLGEFSLDTKTLQSNDVLRILRPRLEKLGFDVEKGKKAVVKIHVPVLYGRNGTVEKYF